LTIPVSLAIYAVALPPHLKKTSRLNRLRAGLLPGRFNDLDGVLAEVKMVEWRD
jgi:hypothetical protein